MTRGDIPVISTGAQRSGETRFSTTASAPSTEAPSLASGNKAVISTEAQSNPSPSIESSVISTGAERSGETPAFSSGRPKAPAPLRYLTYLLLLPLIALATIAFGCISLIAGLWDKSGRQQHAIAHAWAHVLLKISLSPVEVLGLDNLPATPAVYASNHLSYYDTPVLFARLPFQFRILAKHSLWKIPFIGWYLHRSGQVPVDQSSARSTIASLSRGVNTLKAGLPLVLFPEGGRSPDGALQTMLSGAAYMAIKAQLPLVPVTLIGTYELLPMHTYHLTPRPLKLILGTPIPTVGLIPRDADALTQQLLQTIHATYLQHTT